MHYYYILNNEQHGPVTFEELCTLNLQPDTLVWHKDMSDWQPACKLPELASYYAAQNNLNYPYSNTPESPQNPYNFSPPYQEGNRENNTNGNTPNNNNSPKPPMPSTNLVWAILVTILFSIAFGIVAIIYASKVNPLYLAGDYQGSSESSKKAAICSLAALIAGIIFSLVYYLFIFKEAEVY